jgi:uncharacterized protein
MKVIEIIEKYYQHNTLAHSILIRHSNMVAKKAVELANKIKHLNPDVEFIKEAALLHDIGMFLTNEPRLGCYGDKEYICHGYLGRALLEKEGLPRHALVCDRHVGVGLSISDIDQQKLPLPRRDMIPVSLEEKLICYADKFFSKIITSLNAEKSLVEVRKHIERYGSEKLREFDKMHLLFNR